MNAYEKYYLNQVGGALPVFAGARIQKGHGLGSMFRSLVRMAAPLLVKGAKAVGKQVLRSGVQVMNDVASGHNFRDSFKKHGRAGAHTLARKGIRKIQTGKGVSRARATKRRRRVCSGKAIGKVKSSQAKRKPKPKRKRKASRSAKAKKQRTLDIFDH